MDNRKNDGKKIFIIFTIIYLIFNPLFFSIVLNHFYDPTTFTDLDYAALGLYCIGWTIIGIIFILPRFFNFKRKEVKIKTMDEIIDDCWAEHNKEKE